MPGAASLSHDDRDLADGVTAFDLAVAVAQPLERKAMADVRSQEPSVDETRDPREKLARSLRLDVVDGRNAHELVVDRQGCSLCAPWCRRG